MLKLATSMHFNCTIYCIWLYPWDHVLWSLAFMFYSAVLRTRYWRISSEVDQLLLKVTDCYRGQCGVIRLVFCLRQRLEILSILPGFSGLSAWLSSCSSSLSPAGWTDRQKLQHAGGRGLTWGATTLLQSLQMESKWHNAPYCYIKEISSSLVKLGA